VTLCVQRMTYLNTKSSSSNFIELLDNGKSPSKNQWEKIAKPKGKSIGMKTNGENYASEGETIEFNIPNCDPSMIKNIVPMEEKKALTMISPPLGQIFFIIEGSQLGILNSMVSPSDAQFSPLVFIPIPLPFGLAIFSH